MEDFQAAECCHWLELAKYGHVPRVVVLLEEIVKTFF
jgi:hypothetical protein